MIFSKPILVASLNWGLGHASRCIPIIKSLKENGYELLIASDGVALSLLQKEFPDEKTIELPSYKIKYAKKGKNFKRKLLKDSPKIIKAIRQERKLTNRLVRENQISGIISDNRLGVYHKDVPTVFITHQLNVLTGNTSWISSKIHQWIFKKYNQCWVPDFSNELNLSGKLGHSKKPIKNIKYIGTLSRLSKKRLPKKYDLMILLSGPEPQRSLLEEKLLKEYKRFTGKVLFVRGKVENKQEHLRCKNADIYNFMVSSELEIAFNESELILCRSGYTTLMDLAKLEKKAFLIPTPGQYEQVYLSVRMKNLGIAPSCSQDDFSIDLLSQVKVYKGFSGFNTNSDFRELFSLFQGKRKL